MDSRATTPFESIVWYLIAGTFVSGVCSVTVAPVFYPFLNPARQFEYEALMRLGAGLFGMSLFLFLTCRRVFLRWLDEERWRGGLILIFFSGLLLTFIFSSTTLRTEENPIRDWTAGSLLAASLMAFRAAALRQEAVMKLLAVFLGGVFLFGAADERFEFHENIASTVLYFYDIRHGTVDGLDFNAVQDATTLAYAVAGILALGLLLGTGFLFGKDFFENQASRGAAGVPEETIRHVYRAAGILFLFLAVCLPGWGLVFTPEFAAQYIALSHEVQPRVLPFIRNFRIGVTVSGLLFLVVAVWWWRQKQILFKFVADLLTFSPMRISPAIFRSVPVRLFTGAVLLFACAMVLDSWDKSIARALSPGFETGATESFPFSHPGMGWVFYDLAELANFWEEIFEFAAALCFLGMSGTLFQPGYWRKPLGWGFVRYAGIFRGASVVVIVLCLLLGFAP